MEKYWIERLNSKDKNIGYNIAYGGLENGYHSQDTLEKISTNSRSRRWINNGVSDRFVPTEDIENYISSGWNVGRCFVPWNRGKTGVYSMEQLDRMSKVKRGKSPWNKGIPMREESKKKLSESNTGKSAWNRGLRNR